MTKDHGSRPKEAVPTEQTDKPRLDVSRIKEAHPVDDDTALVPFGWAPGGYIGVCNRCGDTHGGCEKRAPRCQECAEFLRDNSPVPTESPVVAGSMLEKAARAMVAAQGDDYDALPEIGRRHARDECRAVLQSARDVNPRVATAGSRASYDGDHVDPIGPAMAATVFTAMIDAILSGEA